MSKISRQDLITRIKAGSLKETLADRVELKSNWKQDFGKDISAIANHINRAGGWLIIGMDDPGNLAERDEEWLKKTEQQVSSHIRSYLNPDFTAVAITGENINGSHILMIEIHSPDDVVYWNSKAYKLIGTSSAEMKPDEILALSVKLPGADYSKLEYNDGINVALVMDFAEKLAEVGVFEANELKNSSPNDVLSRLYILNRKAAGILFGNVTVRIVHYDENGDILDQKEEKGLYSILKDDFIETVQSWTRKEGTILSKHSLAAIEESPYPIEALRDSLTNAVAHALYSKNTGDIIVEMHPDRIAISNNCSLEAKFFANKWFSSASKPQNKLLMVALRAAKITDDLGSGKNRIFRYMIEAGKKEPIIEFTEYGSYGKWKIILYNNEENKNLLRLIEKLKEKFSAPSYWRLATALVLWRDKSVQYIFDMLDEHYKRVAKDILKDINSPVLFFKEKDQLILKRWTKVAIIDGQHSKAFTLAEENNLKEYLNYYAYHLSPQGNISNNEAGRVIGLSNSGAERTQLSRLFARWKEDGVVKSIKRGEWQFVNKPE